MKCPFCAEEIQDAAIKCKHCGEMLSGYGSKEIFRRKNSSFVITDSGSSTKIVAVAIMSIGALFFLFLPFVSLDTTIESILKIGETSYTGDNFFKALGSLAYFAVLLIIGAIIMGFAKTEFKEFIQLAMYGLAFGIILYAAFIPKGDYYGIEAHLTVYGLLSILLIVTIIVVIITELYQGSKGE